MASARPATEGGPFRKNNDHFREISAAESSAAVGVLGPKRRRPGWAAVPHAEIKRGPNFFVVRRNKKKDDCANRVVGQVQLYSVECGS